MSGLSPFWNASALERAPGRVVDNLASKTSLRKLEEHVCITVRFGQRVRVLRRERNLTQVQLAKFLGIDRSFLSDVERGRKTISLSYLETIAQGFNMPLEQLLAGL